MYFQDILSSANKNTEKGGFLVRSGNELSYTGDTLITKNPEILLISSSPVTSEEYRNISSFFNTNKLEVFGCVVDDQNYGNKTILHKSLDRISDQPEWYKQNQIDFSKYTLPGYTCFTLESTITSAKKLLKQFSGETLRLKFGNGYNGIDHYLISSEHELIDTLVKVNEFKDLSDVGISLEINLNNSQAYGVTLLNIFGKTNPTIAKQTSKNNVYIGSELIEPTTLLHKKMLNDTKSVSKLYKSQSLQLNRFNLDYIEGTTKSGDKHLAITDLSLRTGAGTVPELMKILKNKNTGVYQIYSNKAITSKTALMLSTLLKGTGIEIVVASRYTFTLCYPIESRTFFETKAFLELEKIVKNIDYDKNKLFNK